MNISLNLLLSEAVKEDRIFIEQNQLKLYAKYLQS